MTLDQVIDIADASYEDGAVRRSHTSRRACGDTLALFIARELRDCYGETNARGRKLTDADQLEEARRCICSARRQLQAVERAFEIKLDEARVHAPRPTQDQQKQGRV